MDGLFREVSVFVILIIIYKVCVVEIDGKEALAEVAKPTKKTIEEIKVPITEELRSQ